MKVKHRNSIIKNMLKLTILTAASTLITATRVNFQTLSPLPQNFTKILPDPTSKNNRISNLCTRLHKDHLNKRFIISAWIKIPSNLKIYSKELSKKDAISPLKSDSEHSILLETGKWIFVSEVYKINPLPENWTPESGNCFIQKTRSWRSLTSSEFGSQLPEKFISLDQVFSVQKEFETNQDEIELPEVETHSFKAFTFGFEEKDFTIEKEHSIISYMASSEPKLVERSIFSRWNPELFQNWLYSDKIGEKSTYEKLNFNGIQIFEKKNPIFSNFSFVEKDKTNCFSIAFTVLMQHGSNNSTFVNETTSFELDMDLGKGFTGNKIIFDVDRNSSLEANETNFPRFRIRTVFNNDSRSIKNYCSGKKIQLLKEEEPVQNKIWRKYQNLIFWSSWTICPKFEKFVMSGYTHFKSSEMSYEAKNSCEVTHEESIEISEIQNFKMRIQKSSTSPSKEVYSLRNFNIYEGGYPNSKIFSKEKYKSSIKNSPGNELGLEVPLTGDCLYPYFLVKNQTFCSNSGPKIEGCYQKISEFECERCEKEYYFDKTHFFNKGCVSKGKKCDMKDYSHYSNNECTGCFKGRCMCNQHQYLKDDGRCGCSIEGCQECANKQCDLCKEGKYLFQGKDGFMCVSKNYRLEGYGISGQSIKRCQDSSCSNCYQNVSECQRCKTGFIMLEDIQKCTKLSKIPWSKGYGKNFSDLTNIKISKCLLLNCLDCKENYKKCQKCKSGFFKFIDNLGKLNCIDDILLGYGKDLTQNFSNLKKCEIEGCEKCSSDHKKCERCNQEFPILIKNAEDKKEYCGFEGNANLTKIENFEKLTLNATLIKESKQFDFCSKLEIEEKKSKEKIYLKQKLLKKYFNIPVVKYTYKDESKDSNTEISNVVIEKFKIFETEKKTEIFCFKLKQDENSWRERTIKINLEFINSVFKTSKNILIQLNSKKISFEKKMEEIEIKRKYEGNEQIGKSISDVSTPFSGATNGFSIFTFILGFDLFLFIISATQQITLLQNLRLINVKYGDYIQIFFNKLGPGYNLDKDVKQLSDVSQTGFNGKLSKFSIPVVFEKSTFIKLIAYNLSSLTQIVIYYSLLIIKNQKRFKKKWIIYFIRILKKIHFSLFLMNLIPISLQCTHILLHSKKPSSLYVYICLVLSYSSLTFLVCDLIGVFLSIDEIKFDSHRNKCEKILEKKNKIENKGKKNNSENVEEVQEITLFRRKSSIVNKEIDVKKTVKKLKRMLDAENYLSIDLKNSKEKLEKFNVKIFGFLPLIKISIFHAVIISTQKQPIIGLLIILLFEIITLFFNITQYMKHKFLKRKISFFLKISQSSVLILISALMIISIFGALQENVTIQKMLVTILMIGIFLEYIFFVFNLAYTIFEYFKNSKIKKKLKKEGKKYRMGLFDRIVIYQKIPKKKIKRKFSNENIGGNDEEFEMNSMMNDEVIEEIVDIKEGDIFERIKRSKNRRSTVHPASPIAQRISRENRKRKKKFKKSKFNPEKGKDFENVDGVIVIDLSD